MAAFESSGSESALQHRIDALCELFEALLALDHLAVDEEGRCRLHLQHVGGELLVGRDLVEQRLILQAVLDLRLGEGSGAALAYPLVRVAARLSRDMATFDGAGVEAGPERSA